MKLARLLLGTILLLASAGAAAAEPPQVRGRVARFDGPGAGNDVSSDVAVGSDGTVFVAGSGYMGAPGDDDYVTVAYGPSARRLWARSYDGPDQNIDQAAAVTVDPSGSRVFVTGNSFGGPATTTDFATVAYDVATGSELWVARYDGPAHDTDAATDLVVSPDGTRVFVTGASIGPDASLDYATVAYDASTGGQLWLDRYAGPGGDADESFAIGLSPGGERVFVTGYRSADTIDFFTVAYDASTGGRLWLAALDAQGDEQARSLAVDPSGTALYVSGFSAGGPAARRDCLSAGAPSLPGADYITAAHAPATGRRLWVSVYDGPDNDCDEAYGLAAGGGAVYVTGSSFSLSTDSDAATVAYDGASGSELWVARYDGPDHLYDKGDALVVSPDGSQVYVAGSSVGAASDFDFTTHGYETSTGTRLWTHRYNGPGNGFDALNAITMDSEGGRLYVTGPSAAPGGSGDYATIFYRL